MAPKRAGSVAQPPGMTLVEMLVATTMTLIIMGVVAQLFGMLGTGISGSRATMELTARMRTIAQGLRMDLAGITAPTVPPLRPDADAGYFELIEGPMTDVSNGTAQLTGDCDDILMFTTRSFGDPFVGRYTIDPDTPSTIQSPVAEVIYFCRPMPAAAQIVDGSTLHTLHRRQLLVMAYMGLPAEFPSNSRTGSLPSILNDYDISLRAITASTVRPNSLSDLTKRENRFLHNVSGSVTGEDFPFDLAASDYIDDAGYLLGHFTAANRVGEDIILDNVLAFDVKVFDPTVNIEGGTVGLGEYVDLGAGGGAAIAMTAQFPAAGSSIFEAGGVELSNASARKTLARPTYDTFSTHYEANGLDEDGDNSYDEGTNGLDNGGIASLADDPLEAETRAPYPYPLRGIEIRIRCYEPSSRQIRQVTVRHTFVPH